ncbi:MAG TPA: hypothetical protein VKR06_08525 [Ktedonosporobacter sp.]|nr:hypothetical protein [Ktedonosporobacter sp.]
MILILTRFEDDPTVLRLSQFLRDRGADLVIISQSMLEQPSSFSISNASNGGVRSILSLGDRVIDLQEVQAAWLWRSWRPEPLLRRFRPLFAQRDEWRFFENEWAAFHKGVALTLAFYHVFCVNPPPWNIAFEEKCCQLAIAAEIGFCIPPTLYTTRLPIVQRFSEEQGGSIIYKPFRSYLQTIKPEKDDDLWLTRQLFTNRVNNADLVEAEGFMPTPGIFQPYVAKQIELRIVVVGRQLFACAIHSQQSELSRDDWRHYDFANTLYEPYNLPTDLAQKIHRLMDRLGLVFGSIDMILTPQGDYVFLEINPNGQFDFVAQLAGLPIYEHLAAMLLARTVEYSIPPEGQEVLHAD